MPATTMNALDVAVCRPFMTPLAPGQLLEPGVEFPGNELLRRVLSVLWRDCCCPPDFSRAPAPVLQVQGSGAGDDDGRGIRAWWLLDEGMIEEREGVRAEGLRQYFGPTTEVERLWPCYEFRFLAGFSGVEWLCHRSATVSQGHRTRLVVQADGRVRVPYEAPWPVT